MIRVIIEMHNDMLYRWRFTKPCKSDKARYRVHLVLTIMGKIDPKMAGSITPKRGHARCHAALGGPNRTIRSTEVPRVAGDNAETIHGLIDHLAHRRLARIFALPNRNVSPADRDCPVVRIAR